MLIDTLDWTKLAVSPRPLSSRKAVVGPFVRKRPREVEGWGSANLDAIDQAGEHMD